jgi:hypothetical protein
MGPVAPEKRKLPELLAVSNATVVVGHVYFYLIELQLFVPGRRTCHRILWVSNPSCATGVSELGYNKVHSVGVRCRCGHER